MRLLITLKPLNLHVLTYYFTYLLTYFVILLYALFAVWADDSYNAVMPYISCGSVIWRQVIPYETTKKGPVCESYFETWNRGLAVDRTWKIRKSLIGIDFSRQTPLLPLWRLAEWRRHFERSQQTKWLVTFSCTFIPSPSAPVIDWEFSTWTFKIQ